MLLLSDFKKNVDSSDKKIVVDFTGICEPFMNLDCLKMIFYALKKGHQVYLLPLTDSHFFIDWLGL